MKGINNLLELVLLGGLRQAAHVAGDGHGDAPVRHGQLLLDVLGHIHQHRPRAPRPGQVEGLLDHPAQAHTRGSTPFDPNMC